MPLEFALLMHRLGCAVGGRRRCVVPSPSLRNHAGYHVTIPLMNSRPPRPEPKTVQDEDDNGYDGPSKSQLKRDMHALQALGVELIELSKDALGRMPMPEKLADAVREARRITSHEGKRRQVQYVGRLMRTLHDTETAALRAALDVVNGASQAETAKLHAIERMRERLLADDNVLTEFIRRHPGVDPQEGRTLIRNARREAQQNKPPRYFRELFQWIKVANEGAAGSRASANAAVDDEHDEGEEDSHGTR
jgi:ribosome-associated protein